MYGSGASTRIALAILGVQSAGFALIYGIGKCTYGSGASTRIALAILGVQSAGFALIYGIGKCMLMYSWNLLNERFRDGFLIYSNIFTECTTRKWRII